MLFVFIVDFSFDTPIRGVFVWLFTFFRAKVITLIFKNKPNLS